MVYKILRNMAQCKKCDDVIESKYRHDFVKCKCGEIFVDGGKDYFRRGSESSDFRHFLSLAETEEVPCPGTLVT